jgi:hypothetical protein
MAYRNRVFVAFDGDNDMQYYRLMTAWKQSEHIPFNFSNAHDLNYARDSSQEESIKRQLRERLRYTQVFVLLIGRSTRYLFKFVRWEIEQAISLGLPIIGVNLNGLRRQDAELTPPILRSELAIYISFNARIMQYALEHWPDRHYQYAVLGTSGPHFYPETVYKSLGL